MASPRLPPVRRFIYADREIDLGAGVVRTPDGQEYELKGQVYEFLDLLLTYPGRIVSYWEIAKTLQPELQGPRNAERRQRTWSSLDPREQLAIKRSLQSLAYRTRAALGEPHNRPSLLVNRTKLGYAIRRPTQIV